MEGRERGLSFDTTSPEFRVRRPSILQHNILSEYFVDLLLDYSFEPPVDLAATIGGKGAILARDMMPQEKKI